MKFVTLVGILSAAAVSASGILHFKGGKCEGKVLYAEIEDLENKFFEFDKCFDAGNGRSESIRYVSGRIEDQLKDGRYVKLDILGESIWGIVGECAFGAMIIEKDGKAVMQSYEERDHTCKTLAFTEEFEIKGTVGTPLVKDESGKGTDETPLVEDESGSSSLSKLGITGALTGAALAAVALF
jgi:hypothetical protein